MVYPSANYKQSCLFVSDRPPVYSTYGLRCATLHPGAFWPIARCAWSVGPLAISPGRIDLGNRPGNWPWQSECGHRWIFNSAKNNRNCRGARGVMQKSGLTAVAEEIEQSGNPPSHETGKRVCRHGLPRYQYSRAAGRAGTGKPGSIDRYRGTGPHFIGRRVSRYLNPCVGPVRAIEKFAHADFVG